MFIARPNYTKLVQRLESSRCIPLRGYMWPLGAISAPFSASRCIYRVGDVHDDESGNGTFDSGSFLRQLRTRILKLRVQLDSISQLVLTLISASAVVLWSLLATLHQFSRRVMPNSPYILPMSVLI